MNQTDQIDRKYFLLTFDVEDWFQVENFKACIPFSSWSSCELRVEKNVHRLLDLLDSITLEPQSARRKAQGDSSLRYDALTPLPPHEGINSPSPSNLKPQATFFILGWIAERLPHLIREIDDRGHEVGSHGYNHKLCHQCSGDELKDDLIKSKKILEDLIGKQVVGYRAPSFSVDTHLLNVLEELGYHYDSSFNSFSGNSRYGRLTLSKNGNSSLASGISKTFYELPISNLIIKNQVIPMGGGGYFRLIPFSLFAKGVRAILKRQKAYLFYLHPWEIDPEQPRVKEASRQFRFRHYFNLGKTEPRLSQLIRTFKDCRFITCSQYLNESPYGK